MESAAHLPLERFTTGTGEVFSLRAYGLRRWELIEGEFEVVATAISLEYRMITDTFRKQGLARELKPKIAARMQVYKNRYFMLEKPVFVGHYDPATRSFPLMSDATQSMPRLMARPWAYLKDGSVNLMASNMDSFTRYEVTDETEARRFEALSISQPSGNALVYFFAEDVSENARNVTARIMQVKLQACLQRKRFDHVS